LFIVVHFWKAATLWITRDCLEHLYAHSVVSKTVMSGIKTKTLRVQIQGLQHKVPHECGTRLHTTISPLQAIFPCVQVIIHALLNAGNVADKLRLMGDVAAAIKEVLPAKQIIDEMVSTAAAQIKRGDSLLVSKAKL